MMPRLSIVIASLASATALNAGSRVQPRTTLGKVGRVVPTRRGTASPEPEPAGADFQQLASDACITGLRLGTCALMVHHGLDKIQNVDGFSANVVAKFFGFLPGPPQFWTLSAAATQVVGAGLLGIG